MPSCSASRQAVEPSVPRPAQRLAIPSANATTATAGPVPLSRPLPAAPPSPPPHALQAIYRRKLRRHILDSGDSLLRWYYLGKERKIQTIVDVSEPLTLLLLPVLVLFGGH